MFASLIVPVAANGRAFVFITARTRQPRKDEGRTGPKRRRSSSQDELRLKLWG